MYESTMVEMITVLLGLDRQLCGSSTFYCIIPADGNDSVHCVWVQHRQNAVILLNVKCFPYLMHTVITIEKTSAFCIINSRWRH